MRPEIELGSGELFVDGKLIGRTSAAKLTLSTDADDFAKFWLPAQVEQWPNVVLEDTLDADHVG